MISAQTLNVIKKWEGYKATAYKCPMGQWIIGYGISFYAGTITVKPFDKTTEKEAEKDLMDYLEKVCWQDVKDIEFALKKKLSEKQQTAVLSVSFNVYNPSFSVSKCKNFLMQGDYQNAIKEWNWGVCKKHQCKNGLLNRRNAEIELFFGIKNYWK